MTEADYFTLGLRNNAYLNVGLYIANYEFYFKSIIEHLSFVKLRHWELDIRRLSAATLALMTSLNPSFMVNDILKGLLLYSFNDNVNIRHGALYGISEIICGLSGQGHLHCMKDEMKDSVFLKTLSQNEKKLIKAGEYMTEFKDKYEQIRYTNNLKIIDNETMGKVLDIID